MVKNEKTIEKFVVDKIQGSPYQSATTQQTQNEIITTVYKNYLNRDPTPEEVELMSRVMKDKNDIISVVDAVKGLDEYHLLQNKSRQDDPISADKFLMLNTSEIQSSPLLKDLQKANLDTRMEMYRKVIEVYQRVLERMPNNKELIFYSHKFLSNPDFNEQLLSRILESSNEYKILEKNQHNIVNGELPGNITDAQLTMDVVNKYKSVFGNDPSKNTLEFLKHKYVSYKLDEIKFDNFLIFLKHLDENEYIMGENGEVQLTIQRDPSIVQKLATQKEFAKHNFDPNKKSDNNTSSSSLNDRKRVDGLNNDTSDLDGYMWDESGWIDNQNAMAKSQCPFKKPFKDPLYSKLARVQKACTFDGDINPNHDPSMMNHDEFANFQASRNADEMNYACKRTDYFMGMKDNYNLINKYEEKKRGEGEFNAKPLIYSLEPTDASSLLESEKTRVGSIMPEFIYKE